MIALHGLGVPPAQWLRLIVDAAQDAGYIVAAPMGYNVHGWYGANGPTSGQAEIPNLGELSEQDVMNVLELVRKDFNVDERRIYLLGQSMGGAGALFLGVKHKDIWAAVGASAPAVRQRWHTPSDLESASAMPMILVQGDADQAVPVEQTRLWAEKMKSLKMTYEYHELPRRRAQRRDREWRAGDLQVLRQAREARRPMTPLCGRSTTKLTKDRKKADPQVHHEGHEAHEAVI